MEMANSTKTPVALLQELAVKKGSIPEYELIFSKQDTHENIFHYQVTLFNIRAIGVGRSKKEAKHGAASRALEALSDRGIVHMDIPNKLPTKVALPMKSPENCIPKLLDICVENKIAIADFIEISAVGPPHCREFTYECRIANIITRAAAGSKEHAKQIAAKSMLERIITILPELQLEVNESMVLENDAEIIEKARNLSKFGPTKINYNCKVKEFDLQFKHLMVDMDINPEMFEGLLNESPSERLLNRLVEPFDLEVKTSIIQEKPAILCIAINSDTPVTVIEIGRNVNEATNLAITKMVKIMSSFLM